MDKGSTTLGGLAISSFSALSVLPVGSKGCRLLRGRGEVLVGEVEGCVMLTSVFSADDSKSDASRSSWVDGGGLRDGGRGDGVRGPLGRSEDCRERGRGRRDEPSGVEAFVGVMDSGRV